MNRRHAPWLLCGAFALISAFLFGQASRPAPVLAQGQPASGSILDRLLSVEAKIQAAGAPVGAVVAFAGPESSVPKSWRPCNGQTLDWGDYSDLAKTIGTTYGGRQGSTLRLPDYRGYFLRGLDGGAGRDPDGARRQLGSAQKDGVGSHQHIMRSRHGKEGSGKGIFAMVPPSYRGARSDDVPSVETGEAETRPKNIAVHWIIKVKP